MTRLLVALSVLALALLPSYAFADTNSDVIAALATRDLYISPHVTAAHHVRPGDKNRLLSAIGEVSKKGVAVKVALVGHYPHTKDTRNPFDAADHLRNYLGFSGVLVLVSPTGMGLSSDYLSGKDVRQVVQGSQPLCTTSYASCAIAALQASVPRVKAEESGANRNVAIFWVIAAVLFAVLVTALIMSARRHREPMTNGRGSRPVNPAPSPQPPPSRKS